MKKIIMIIKYNDLKKIREKHKNKKIIFCSGSYDLLHAGHVLFFEDCKKRGDILIVGVGDDSILKTKGSNRPILNQNIRIKMVDSIKTVDYCFIHKNIKGEFLNSFIDEILRLLSPNLWIVNEDASEIDFRKKLSKKYNIKFSILKRKCPKNFENISTSKIIEKIRKEK